MIKLKMYKHYYVVLKKLGKQTLFLYILRYIWKVKNKYQIKLCCRKSNMREENIVEY